MSTGRPTISVIINTIDRVGPLRTLLQALEHQSYPFFEVIVVVGPTRDNTLEMLSEYGDRVRVLRCPTANLGRSRNIGLLAARGDIVAFIDDDAVPSCRWLEQIARLFVNENLDATGGAVYLAHPNNPTTQHRIGIISSLAEQIDVRSSWLEHLVPPGDGSVWVARMMGTNMAFRRRSLMEVGGFDEFFEWVYDDSDVALRLTSAGKIVHPVKEAVVYHFPASSRNRVAFTYTGKWWLQTKSAVYFCIKNGLAAGDTYRAIARRVLHLVHGHWLWYGHLWREGKLSFLQLVRMRFADICAAIVGAFLGAFLPRQLISPGSGDEGEGTQAIQLFQTNNSANTPSVDPVDGVFPLVSLPSPPLRVCLLSSAYPPDQFEGVGRHTNLLARGLFECGHTVHVIAQGEREQTAFYDGAYVHRIPLHLDRYFQYQKFSGLYYALNYSHGVYEKVRRLMLNEGIQVVDSPLWQLEGLVTAVSGILPVVLRLQTAHRQIANIQGDRDEDAYLMGEMERVFIERSTYLVPNSRAMFEAMEKLYGLTPREGRYLIVPHGVVPVPEEDIRPFDLQRKTDTFTVLYVGRLEKRKGIMTLFQAIPLVMQKVQNVKFIIAGGDNSIHDGFRHQTGMDYPSYFVKRYPSFVSCVHFLGAVDEEVLRGLYQTCDLFVAPSLYESFGLVFLEAMNYAKPVVGCHAGGVPEVVAHGVSGLLVEPEDPAALADAIVSLLKSPTKLYEMGMAGRQLLLEKFTHIQMARHFEQVYRAAIQIWHAQSPDISSEE